MAIDSIDTLAQFSALANEFNAQEERLKLVGEADMRAVLVMRRGDSTSFCVRVIFEALRCDSVDVVDEADAVHSDFRLVGPLSAWLAMFDDIEKNGRATGLQTINSLALLGDDIALVGNDVMGVDKFSRFNQTLQEYLDGAARVAVAR